MVRPIDTSLEQRLPLSTDVALQRRFMVVARVGVGDDARSVPVDPLEYGEEIEARRRDKAIRRQEAYRRRQSSPPKAPTREEFELLARLHAAQEQPGFSGRLAGRLTSM